MAKLFQRDKSTISRHIKNIFEEGELSQVATVAKYATVQTESSRTVERSIDCYSSGHISHKQAIEKVAFLSCILNVYFYFQNIGHTSLQIPTNFLVFKTPISVNKIQKQVILSYKNALFSPSTQIKEIPYKNF